MRMFLWSAVVFYEGESHQQACGRGARKYIMEGQREGNGDLTFRQGGAQQLEVG